MQVLNGTQISMQPKEYEDLGPATFIANARKLRHPRKEKKKRK